MKKFLSIFAILALCVAFAAGCGDYGGQGTTNRPIDPTTPVNPVTPSENAFKVTLKYDGKPFVHDSGLKALWSDGMSYREAEFDSDGVAQASGLDGEYRVTLSGLSADYTYNPNIYYANNDNRDVEIELFKLGTTGKNGRGNGTLWNEHVVNYDGYYRATFTTARQANDGIYFLYVPLAVGKYSVESIIDVTANDVNPILDIYVGNIQFLGTKSTRDEGGVSSNFTKNFRYDVQLDSVGNVFRFAVRFESRGDISLPVNIDFYVKYEGLPDPDDYNSVPVTDFDDFNEVASKVPANEWGNPAKSWTYAYTRTGGKKYLYGNRYGLNPDDGLYHVLNSDGSYGPVLLAIINVDSELIATESGFGFMDPLVSCRNLNGKNYNNFVETYASHTKDGRFPVTQKVKDFLQEFAVSQRYFMDGRGWAEGAGYMSEEEDQWLFNCGYLV